MKSEQALIDAAREGNQIAQGALVERYQERVFRLAYRITGNAHDAEDVAQEALVKALGGLATFRGDAAFGTWLYRIAYNTALTHCAQRREHDDIAEVDVAAPAAADTLEQGELAAAISGALAELSPRQRECLQLQRFEEMSIADIAAVTGIGDGSVKQHLFRAVAHLRKRLAKFAEGAL